MERSRHDIRAFYEWLGYTWGEHIDQWINMYSENDGSEVHRVCIIAPRDHSKSTTLRVMLLHQCLFRRKGDGKPFTIALISASKDTAVRRLQEIRDDMLRHPQLSKYLDPKRGNKTEIYFTNGAYIVASSVGSAIRGEHPACVAFDDVLVDNDDMNPKALQNWFRKTITPMLSPGSFFYVVGTPMSMTDLYHTEMLENPAWKTGIWSCFSNWDEWKADSENVEPIPIWPEYRSKKFLLEQRVAMGELAFTQESGCRVVDDDSAVFPSHITRINMDMTKVIQWESEHEGKYAIGFDPAHGIKQDYSVMVTLRRDSEGYIHFVNMWRRNDFSPMQQIDQIIAWNNSYNHPIFASEDVGFQRLYNSLLQQKNAHIDFRPSKVSNRALKQGLLSRVRAVFESGKIVWPYGDDKTRTMVNLILNEFEGHAWDSGLIVDKTKHNDCVMAFAHACDMLIEGGRNVSMASGTVDATSWNKNTKPKSITRSPRGRFVPFGG